VSSAGLTITGQPAATAAGNDNADGFADGESDAACARRRPPHRYDLALLRTHSLDAQMDAVDRAGHFDPGVHQGLASFARRLQGQCLAVLLHDLCGPLQDGDAIMQGQPAITVAERSVSGAERRFDMALITDLDLREDRVVEGRSDLVNSDCLGRAFD
jgi:hypothetical protein